MKRLITMVSLLIFCLPVFSADALRVMPTRLVLMDKGAGELTLVNNGDELGNYRILLRDIRTNDTGQFSVALEAKGDELFASKFLKYSPRQIEVNAGEYQKVRVFSRLPKTLGDGEYRTHMVFQSLPKNDGNLLNNIDSEVSVDVQPIVEITIPIIIRSGKLNAKVSLDNILLNDKEIYFDLNRTGTRSLYGDIEVLVNSGKHKGTRLGYVRGMSVYYPNLVRKILMPIVIPEGMDLTGSEIVVKFREDPDYGGDQTAQKSLTYQ